MAVDRGPHQPFAAEDAARIRAWFEGGGNLFLLASPVPDAQSTRMLPLGLETITQAAGIVLDEDFVFEVDPARKLPGGFGEQFLAEPKAHDITQGLVGENNRDLKNPDDRGALAVAPGGELRGAPGPNSSVTSPEAFGMTDFFAWAEKGGPPSELPAIGGPLRWRWPPSYPKAKRARCTDRAWSWWGRRASRSVRVGKNGCCGAAPSSPRARSLGFAAESTHCRRPDKPAVAGRASTKRRWAKSCVTSSSTCPARWGCSEQRCTCGGACKKAKSDPRSRMTRGELAVGEGSCA